MMSDDDQAKAGGKKEVMPGLAQSTSETSKWGRWTTQMVRSEAYKMLEAYGIAGEYPDKGDYACMIAGLEQIQMVNSFLMRQPELREVVREGLHNIKPEAVQMLKLLLGSLQRSELAGVRYKPEFCEVCYCHRDARSAAYCQLHKPLAADKKAYQHGKRRFDVFFEAAIKRYNAANAAKKIPHGLDMVLPEGFNYPNIVQLLSAFPLANAKLLPAVHECRVSGTPLSSFEVLARIYGKALDPDGVDLVRRVETADW